MKPYDKMQWQGHTLNWRTAAMLYEVEARLGYELDVLQGSYNPGGVGVSGGTHDGGGAVDLSPYDWEHKVHAMRAVGFACWHRTAIPGTWNEHCHAIAIGDKQMSDAARQQVTDYYNHIDGLAGHTTPDNTWHPDPIPVFDFDAWKRANTLLPEDRQFIADQTARIITVINARAKGTRDTVLKAIDALPTGATKKDVRDAVDKAFAAQTPEETP